MRTLFFGSHSSQPSHPISALTVSSAHSILVPLAMPRPPLSSLATLGLDLQENKASCSLTEWSCDTLLHDDGVPRRRGAQVGRQVAVECVHSDAAPSSPPARRAVDIRSRLRHLVPYGPRLGDVGRIRLPRAPASQSGIQS